MNWPGRVVLLIAIFVSLYLFWRKFGAAVRIILASKPDADFQLRPIGPRIRKVLRSESSCSLPSLFRCICSGGSSARRCVSSWPRNRTLTFNCGRLARASAKCSDLSRPAHCHLCFVVSVLAEVRRGGAYHPGLETGR